MLEVGRITRAHGIKGEVVVVLSTDRSERLDPGTVLDTDRGPLTVTASRPHKHHWLVVFDGCTTRTEAEELRGTVLRAEPLADSEVDWIHELIGATVVDHAGTELGTVAAVEANPAADLLVLDGGELVPMNFVVDTSPGRITVEIPEGLLDI